MSSTAIHRISAAELESRFLEAHVYPDLRHTLYWSDDWDPALYVALARAGFISVAHAHSVRGFVLLPELQRSYAVLDWNRLHVSRRVRKLLASDRMQHEGIELAIGRPRAELLQRLTAHHAPRCWLCPPYQRLLKRLPREGGAGFSIQGVELWSRSRSELVAGELGYTIGSTYTSLSGFYDREDARWSHFGTLQLVLLAQRLRDCGYSFWNLGHPHLAYKQALGARILDRPIFLRRWQAATQQSPETELHA